MTKQEIAQKKNYFKFVLIGLYKPVDCKALTEWELEEWATIFNVRDELIARFDANSKLMGLNVPEHRCWCGKEGKYDIPEEYPNYLKDKNSKVCKKHLKID